MRIRPDKGKEITELLTPMEVEVYEPAKNTLHQEHATMQQIFKGMVLKQYATSK